MSQAQADTVGALLEHIPRDRRAARTIGELARDEVATVVVEVLTITSRPVRRRGMKPLVEPRVADASGTMVGDLLQPAVAGAPLPARARGCSSRASTRPPRRGFRVNEHAETGEQVTDRRGMATYPASDGLTSVQIAALAARAPRDGTRCARAAACPPARARRLPDRRAALDAAHFGDQEGGRRRLAFDEFLLLQIALLRRRSRRREAARAAALEPPGELTARWLARLAPVHADR